MFNNPRGHFFVLIFGVLLIQNAVFPFPEANAPKTVLASVTGNAVEQIRTLISACITKDQTGNIVTTRAAIIDKFSRTTEECIVAAIVRFVVEIEAIVEILAVLNEVTILHIARFKDTITRAVFYLMHDGMRAWMLVRHVFKFLSIFFSRLK
ncbi:hypothetical protein A3A67_01160 [Candidatus Peribacteria bacterium RIFCSPLOWO2_01_FULL_51_18]|nr:MAG: hypothetical protein A3C52_02380 [Candidatus Peribacteria bacterium RIFCSPHIGHO2_02_FULL_51_15]OGJ65455.1 MAG: hypothetical protein A3A67_01160 [Candidatus Peribacteria bacterium RIFCSPLOWO2_01_FULL_51_18]OGJ69117.1 MAG: hypothetical protein A3J34_04005 [Candidatus Peribacteria bacterium RIFCSPLOWO2_02_FULL_51_10]